MEIYDKVVIGAGLYGLYAALQMGRRGKKILVIEYENAPFLRATYINQARVHNGYHYPRSFSTAIKSAGYFNRFNLDYQFCINFAFQKIYATSAKYSWTDAKQFLKFCKAAKIKCQVVDPDLFFKPGMCDGVFETQEYTYDAMLLKEYFLVEIAKLSNITCMFEAQINRIERDDRERVFSINLNNGQSFRTDFILNATYASINQIHSLLGYEPFKIKYELCEIILCEVNEKIKNVGITVMDGPFFSLMPFGKTGLHSLTSVTFTPHLTSFELLPTFKCQQSDQVDCSPSQLGNCNLCPNKPKSAWPYMLNLAEKYLSEDINIQYHDSLYSVKPILMASEIDDSRPTLIKRFSDVPAFFSVLSGKINTIYDLDEVLNDD